MVVSGFDWDEGNSAKCEKHGVLIEEVEDVLTRAPLVAPDVAHSKAEDRFIPIGRTAEGRPIFVAFTFRQIGAQRFVRPVLHAPERD